MNNSKEDSKEFDITNEEKQNTALTKKSKPPFIKSLLEQVEIIVIFFAVIVLIFSFACKTCRVDGDSMVDTLHHEELVLIWDFFYTPKMGDIVVIHDDDALKKPIVKRVIGLPGDTVYIEHNHNSMKVIVTHEDGSSTELKEDYAHYNGTPFYYSPTPQTFEVGDGEVFVMGDNRFDSLDSRILGCYDQRQILGKVLLRLTPLNKFGTVD